jgi:hypothetical protein
MNILSLSGAAFLAAIATLLHALILQWFSRAGWPGIEGETRLADGSVVLAETSPERHNPQ